VTARVAHAMVLASCLALMASAPASADPALVPQPVVTVSASADRSVPNDRMHAALRAEAEETDAVKAADVVNTRMARALARAKATAGIETSTSTYKTYQVGDPNQGPVRWHVTQSLEITGADFMALAALASKLQAEDGMLMSGLRFSLSPAALRAAQDALTQQAIRAWQDRAKLAAQALGSTAWRTGRVTVQTIEPGGEPLPFLRMQTAALAKAAPVSTEAGDTEVTVTVSGEAILEPAK
jgi:predicted secreted protein